MRIPRYSKIIGIESRFIQMYIKTLRYARYSRGIHVPGDDQVVDYNPLKISNLRGNRRYIRSEFCRGIGRHWWLRSDGFGNKSSCRPRLRSANAHPCAALPRKAIQNPRAHSLKFPWLPPPITTA